MNENIEFQTIITLLKQTKSYDKNSPVAIAKGKYKIVKKKRDFFKVIKSKLKCNG